ncbi:hypothetical protein ECA0518 [Pectobacterium atrosepticum SCRI1043]|uniref:Uncharacterized protein n=2 Tax=Pectobacterium atrosepticum TaxID=29471 RepID=Q6D9U5_PECAS|nr:hypothetical protein [Pectobacterium atrosepticum]GKV85823.1 hypothetical protein PEC301296_21350 [Pectobacterium carotovorum subsp. carotovorum]AFH56813.1 hypothetical protein KCQ_12850 [Pectobacterium atrosepticum]AIA69858.1 hypothetical protein EV46_04485 [Pectobacterium atrosepticum]AIK12771.1 hypothetical protein GZ59_09050 [Pectobacterium atrosepticum]ATY89355.1 hypothetical protein CVS35_02715 [Pectobacterium atrosepticum]
MKTLHRAFCSCNHWRYKDVDEQTVFFETFHTEHAGERLRSLLANTWGVPESSVIVYNVFPERELSLLSLDDSSSDDKMLFETGWDRDAKRPCYLDDFPLMLVSPRTYKRLVKAFMSISQIGCGGKEAAHG